MKMAGVDEHAMAKALDVSYQAIKKVLLGTSKMLRADNNVRAAQFLRVDSEWLATGQGSPAGGKSWPFTAEVLDTHRGQEAEHLRRAENQLRVYLEMPILPREPDGKQPHAA